MRIAAHLLTARAPWMLNGIAGLADLGPIDPAALVNQDAQSYMAGVASAVEQGTAVDPATFRARILSDITALCAPGSWGQTAPRCTVPTDLIDSVTAAYAAALAQKQSSFAAEVAAGQVSVPQGNFYVQPPNVQGTAITAGPPLGPGNAATLLAAGTPNAAQLTPSQIMPASAPAVVGQMPLLSPDSCTTTQTYIPPGGVFPAGSPMAGHATPTGACVDKPAATSSTSIMDWLTATSIDSIPNWVLVAVVAVGAAFYFMRAKP